MPEHRIRPGYENQGALVFERRRFQGALLDNFTKPPAQDPDTFSLLTNVEPITNGRLQRRRGYALLSTPTIAPRRIFESHFASGANRFVLTASDGSGQSTIHNRVTSINESGDRGHATNNIFTPSASALQPYAATSRQFVYFADGISGDLKKWDGQDDPSTAGSVTQWGFSGDAGAFTAADNGAGNITVEVGRKYVVAFLYTTTSHAVLITDSATGLVRWVDSGVLTARQIRLSSVPTFTVGSTGYVSANFHRVILATSDNGPLDTLYEVGRITDNTTTTFDDNIDEEVLLAKPKWAMVLDDGREIGAYDNTTPVTTIPTASIVVPHNGRLFAITEQFLFWSKNLAELTTDTNTITGKYEECWPASNQMPVAVHSEFARGLLSDGTRLYVGTDRGIRALEGDFPYFSPLNTIFHEAGLLRQDTWKIVSHAGQQVAAIWLTPDRRVVASDFNTYENIGLPVQDTLNDIDIQAARNVACATYFSDGPMEWYMLAVPAPGSTTATASGTAQAGGAATITLAATSSALNDFYNGATISITGGTGSGQARFISDYVGSTKVATVSVAWATPPDGTSTYTIFTVENDKLLLYNINTQCWVMWTPTDVVLSQAFMQDIINNRALGVFGTASSLTVGKVYRWIQGSEIETATNLRDRVNDTPSTYAVVIKTPWLDWDLPQVTKFLNELEVHTGDSAMTVGVEGASTEAEFDTPVNVQVPAAIVSAPRGQYKSHLAAKFSKYRYYKFTFTSPISTVREVLSYLAIEAIPVHRF